MSIREKNKIKTRQRLLRSARHLFSSKGYNETMMSEIAEAAEVSDATLYNYFPAKSDLLIGIAKEETGELRALVESERNADMPADEQIRSLLLAHLRDVLSYTSLARRIAFTCADLGQEESVTSEVNDLLFTLLERGKEDGVFRKEMDSRDATHIIYGLHYEILFNDPEIEKCDIEETTEKYHRLLDVVLSGVCLK